VCTGGRTRCTLDLAIPTSHVDASIREAVIPPKTEQHFTRTRPMAKQGPRKKLPKELAVINADNCTGCEACLEVCPVDCIVKIQQYDNMFNLQSWCQIDLERCVGCEVCVHIPTKKTDPYELTVCPWDA